jgi:hypothetical protein
MFMFSWLRVYTLAIYSPLAGLNFNIGAEKAQEEWQPPLLCDSNAAAPADLQLFILPVAALN